MLNEQEHLDPDALPTEVQRLIVEKQLGDWRRFDYDQKLSYEVGVGLGESPERLKAIKDEIIRSTKAIAILGKKLKELSVSSTA
jgi:hypothetical protein